MQLGAGLRMQTAENVVRASSERAYSSQSQAVALNHVGGKPHLARSNARWAPVLNTVRKHTSHRNDTDICSVL